MSFIILKSVSFILGVEDLQTKKLAFKRRAVSDLHSATKELKMEILKAKQSYKSKLQEKMAKNNLDSTWANMKTITGLQSSHSSNHVILDDLTQPHNLVWQCP